MPYNDVLEVFVRVNSGGVVLKKSDLVFSTLVLTAPEMENEFIQLVDALNGRGQFDFDIDFLSKASFVIYDKKAKYDIKKLEDGDFVKKLKNGFASFEAAITSTMEFLGTNAKILSKRFLKSDLAMIPIIDFVVRLPHQHLSEGQSAILKQYLYMAFFMRFYSYGADAKLDKFHEFINVDPQTGVFPIEKIRKYMEEKTSIKYAFSRSMLYDLDLILNIIEGGVVEIPQRRGWSLERDHIFPRAILEKEKIPDQLINNVGNLRLVNKTRNILKSDKLPEEHTEFYGASNKELKELFLKARDELNKTNFSQFVEKREELIFEKVKIFLEF